MKNTIQSILGQNVRRYRLRMGISQEELAFQIGIHRTYIGSVERGERNVGIVNIVKIAEALEAHVSSLVEGLPIKQKKD